MNNKIIVFSLYYLFFIMYVCAEPLAPIVFGDGSGPSDASAIPPVERTLVSPGTVIDPATVIIPPVTPAAPQPDMQTQSASQTQSVFRTYTFVFDPADYAAYGRGALIRKDSASYDALLKFLDETPQNTVRIDAAEPYAAAFADLLLQRGIAAGRLVIAPGGAETPPASTVRVECAAPPGSG